MKNKLLLLLPILLISFAFVSSAYSGAGTGTGGDPFQITTCSQLQEMENYLSNYFILMNNIDCSATSTWNGGTGFEPIGGTWYGYLDGQGFTISNLYINRPTEEYVGLFSQTHGGAGSWAVQFNHLNLENVNITGGNYTGGLVGILEYSQVENVSITGNIKGSNNGGVNIGGIAGLSNNGRTYNSSFSGAIIGVDYVGGIYGYDAGMILDSNVSGDISGFTNVGGLVGYKNQYMIVSNSLFSGNVIIRTAPPENTPPTIDNPISTIINVTVGQNWVYDYNATDVDIDDNLTWTDNTSLFNINSQTGAISFTPTSGQIGSHIINISVTDDGMAGDSNVFNLNVIAVQHSHSGGGSVSQTQLPSDNLPVVKVSVFQLIGNFFTNIWNTIKNFLHIK